MIKKFNGKFLLRAGVSTALLSWLLFSLDWQETWAALRGIDPLFLLIDVLLIAAAVGVSVVKWRLILKVQGIGVSAGELWNAYWVGLFFNNFLPSSIGGDAMRIFLIGKNAGNTPGVACSVVVERVLATLGLAMVGLGASFFSGENLLNIRVLFIILAAVSLILAAVLVWGRIPNFLKRGNGKAAHFAGSFIQYGGCLGKKPFVVFQVVIWSAFFQVINVAVNYYLFKGLGITQVAFDKALFLIPATAAAAMIPVGINGYGIREGAYVALLAHYGVSRSLAFTASLLYAFLVSMCSLWGGILWLRSNRKREGKCFGTTGT
ncbi:MAG: lysylphosphatidylglycerol synthase transmembrane domain-containing protein [Desulfitobacteriaceae bacterium]|nr:lysylphosphatidylglycerol synthase transmembrane domain-containing protein [Desulfitobacteriaceae bacterium]